MWKRKKIYVSVGSQAMLAENVECNKEVHALISWKLTRMEPGEKIYASTRNLLEWDWTCKRESFWTACQRRAGCTRRWWSSLIILQSAKRWAHGCILALLWKQFWSDEKRRTSKDHLAAKQLFRTRVLIILFCLLFIRKMPFPKNTYGSQAKQHAFES